MTLIQLAFTTTFLIFSHLAIGATYDLPEEQQLNLPSPDFSSTPGNDSDDAFTDLQFPDSQAQNSRLRQDYLEVVKLLKNKQLDSAENKLQNLIQKNPKEADFYNLQASLELLKNKPDIAIKSYQKAIKLDPKNLKSQLGLAVAFLKSGNLIQAKEHANTALSINDNLAHPYILLAEIAYHENKQQDIEDLLLTAQRKAQGNSQQEIMVADRLVKLYASQKQPQKTLNVAQGIIHHYPNNSSALALLASTQIFNNKTEQAITTLEKLINQEPKTIHHRILLAKLLAKQPENKQRILQLLDEVSTIAPDNPQVQIQKTIILTQIKQFPDALQSAKKVKQLAPDTGLAEILEGEIYLAEKKQGQALIAFQKSYAIKPNPKVMNIISNIMLAQGKQSDAVNFLNKELKKNPKNLTAHFKLGNIYQQQNRLDDAEIHYQAILAEQPENVVILNNLAWIYHKKNNPKALSLAKKAYQKAPKSAAIADTYAVILVKQGKLTKGIQIFEKASKLAPQDYDIQYHLAEAYALNKQPKQAKSILNTIVSSKQNFSERDAAISLLKKLE